MMQSPATSLMTVGSELETTTGVLSVLDAEELMDPEALLTEPEGG